MTRTRTLLAGAFVAAWCSGAAPAASQGAPTAIVNARILMAAKGETLENATLVLRDGKIEEVGPAGTVRVPRGATLVDAKGMVVMPGIVNAASRVGLARTAPRPTPPLRVRRGRVVPGPSGSPSAAPVRTPRASVLEALDPRHEAFEEVLAAGVTTVGLLPAGNGFPGQGAVVRPEGRTAEEMAVKKGAFLLLGMEASTPVKDMLRGTFEAAKKEMERRKEEEAKKKEEETKKKEEEAKKQEEEKKEGEEKEEGGEGAAQRPPQARPVPRQARPAPQQRQQRPDPDLDPVIDAIEGKLRVFVDAGSANEAAHFFHAMKEHMLPAVFVAGGASPVGLHQWAEELGKAKARVVMAPSLTTQPYTRILVNPARELLDKGVEVSFHAGSSAADARRVFFDLMELVRAGLTPAEALAGVTINPARVLGVEDRVGSVEKGRDANLLLLSGDPLEPTTRLLAVWLEGRLVADHRREP